MNEILQATFEEFLPLEKEHSDQTVDASGHVITKLQPLPATQLEALQNQLWTQLDAILDVDQQARARSTLPLHAHPRVLTGKTLRQSIQPGILGWSRDGGRIEVWKEGTWYQWTIEHGGRQSVSESGPELPAKYGRYWIEAGSAKAEVDAEVGADAEILLPGPSDATR